MTTTRTHAALAATAAAEASKVAHAQSVLASHGVDLGDLPVFTPAALVGIIAETALAADPASTVGEPLVFESSDLAHAARCLLQCAHDRLGIHGLLCDGDAVEFVLAESSDDAAGVVIVAREIYGGRSLDSLDHADGLSFAGILAAACGVSL